MNEETRRLLGQAEEHRSHHRFEAAAECLERATRSADAGDRAGIWRRAAETWVEHGDVVRAGRCFREAGSLLAGSARIDCLFACWRAYVDGIVREEWECGFEWRGEGEEHAVDHDSHQRTIETYHREGEQILALMVAEAEPPRAEVLARARAECARLEAQGGWGARRCRAMVSSVSGSPGRPGVDP
ncbi:MAG: hypothetical protein PVI57_09095 [Gemmatimonadota bacterium]